MSERGIDVEGEHLPGEAPEGAQASWPARSLRLTCHVVLGMNKHSSNFVAEHVLKAVGAEVHGEPGSTEKGLRVVEEYLVSLGAEEMSLTS